MIKVICDSCGEEPPMDGNFMFEATAQEIIYNLDSNYNKANPQIKKTLIQLCRKCYEDKIKILLKNI